MILNHYLPAPEGILHYSDRENLKSEGWNDMRENNPIEVRIEGLRKVIESHYWREKEYLLKVPKRTLKKYFKKEYFPGFELTFDLYASHWLAANGHRTDIAYVRDIVKPFKEKYKYKAIANYYFSNGMSGYREPNWSDKPAISD